MALVTVSIAPFQRSPWLRPLVAGCECAC